MTTRRSILALAITTSLFLCGCVANRAYRRGDEVSPPEPPRSVDGILPSNADCDPHSAVPLDAQPQHFYLAHIEFDDMGELWSIGNLRGEKKGTSPSSQLENALAIITKAQAQANEPGDQRELTVITFVHGWHNNASEYDEAHKDKNLASFKSMMQELSCWQMDKTQKPPVLVGIFLSWRGQGISGDPGVTYWTRRDAATRVGGPSMTEVVTRLMFETKGVPIAPSPDAESKCEPPDVKGKDHSHFVIIAHSFGARALEHALTEPMLSMILERQMQARECADEYNSNKPGKPITELTFLPPADLIVFLNAANDAFEAKETIEALKRAQIRVRKKTNNEAAESIDTTAPFMISITSDGDWATKKIMPVAQLFSSWALRFRSYDKNCADEGQLCGLSQRYYYRHSEASMGEMRSHLVILAKDASSCNSFPPPWPYFEVYSTNRCFCVDSSRAQPNSTDKCGANTDDRKAYFGANPGWNDTPFYVMGVPESLIKDHNDIFQEGTVQLLNAISEHYEILFKSKERVTMSSPLATKP